MELFIFIRMVGATDEVVVKLVGSTSTLLARDTLARSLANFDAAQAKCFLAGDRHRLLAVIEASFGTFEPFNKMVRDIFVECMRERHQSIDFSQLKEVSAVRSISRRTADTVARLRESTDISGRSFIPDVFSPPISDATVSKGRCPLCPCLCPARVRPSDTEAPPRRDTRNPFPPPHVV
jgi:hypothetical protein